MTGEKMMVVSSWINVAIQMLQMPSNAACQITTNKDTDFWAFHLASACDGVGKYNVACLSSQTSKQFHFHLLELYYNFIVNIFLHQLVY